MNERLLVARFCSLFAVAFLAMSANWFAIDELGHGAFTATVGVLFWVASERVRLAEG